MFMGHSPHRTPIGTQYSVLSTKYVASHSTFRVPHSALLCFWCVAFLTGCAGYQLGQRSLYRPDICTVHIPVIQSDSFRRYLGERLTEAVVKEVELRTPYKVVG